MSMLSMVSELHDLTVFCWTFGGIYLELQKNKFIWKCRKTVLDKGQCLQYNILLLCGILLCATIGGNVRMNNFYTAWYKASRNFSRRGIDAQYRPSEETGTSFAGKTCVRSHDRVISSGRRKKAGQKTMQP